MTEVEIIKKIGEKLKKEEQKKSGLNKRWLKNWITEREYIRELARSEGRIAAFKEAMELL